MNARIIITHGFFIDEWADILTAQRRDNWCGYCAITCCKLTNDNGTIIKKVLINANDSHVKSRSDRLY